MNSFVSEATQPTLTLIVFVAVACVGILFMCAFFLVQTVVVKCHRKNEAKLKTPRANVAKEKA